MRHSRRSPLPCADTAPAIEDGPDKVCPSVRFPRGRNFLRRATNRQQPSQTLPSVSGADFPSLFWRFAGAKIHSTWFSSETENGGRSKGAAAAGSRWLPLGLNVSIAVQNLHAGTHSTARIEYRGWPPPCRSACRSPPVQRLRRQPQRQTAALAQTPHHTRPSSLP